MRTHAPITFVTPHPWHPGLQHSQYGPMETYLRAAAWLDDCRTVADWGGGPGVLGKLLGPKTRYSVVDGTFQYKGQIVADLSSYGEPSEGIMLRHVLEHVADWQIVLRNALRAMTHRLVLITFTPDADVTGIVRVKSGWPVREFAPEDLRCFLGPYLVADESVVTTHPERIYYVERTA